MNHLHVALAARAHQGGRAVRSSTFRHRNLVDKPLAVVVWQLGAEPFAPGAIAWGSGPDRFEIAVAGEPRNRDLLFAATLQFARWFNERFEAPGQVRENISDGESTFSLATTAPQVLVANAATGGMLGRLGRRLAYLTAAGGTQPDPDLIKLGRHLLFLSDHEPTVGQQLLIPLTDLLNAHWAVPLSATERQSLPALDAYIDPPKGLHGFQAAARAELLSAGPLPAAECDEALSPLVDEFNSRRAGRTSVAVVAKLKPPIEEHYRKLTEPVWDLLWRCREREVGLLDAPSVARRWDEDRRAYTRHMDWMEKCGLRRTRHTPRRAAMVLRSLEDAKERTEAEEALDDPLRMIPYLLDNKAVRGRVLRVNRDHRELATKRLVRRPLVVLLSPDRCQIAPSNELFWTQAPAGCAFVVEAVQPQSTGCQVTLKLMTSSAKAQLPSVGSIACFSTLTLRRPWSARLPFVEPWTHRPAQQVALRSIEDDGPSEGQL